MNRFDYWAKKVFGKAEVFADAFNGMLFEGENVIKADSLQDVPTTQLARIGRRKIKRERDLLKRLAFKTDGISSFVMLGIEAQSYADRTIAARAMLYDAILYIDEIAEVFARNRNKKNLPKEYFLSGFLPDDMISPVVTMVMDLSGDDAQPVRSLHEILNFGDERFREFVSDYRINVVSPTSMERDKIMRYGRDAGAVMLSAKFASYKKLRVSCIMLTTATCPSQLPTNCAPQDRSQLTSCHSGERVL